MATPLSLAARLAVTLPPIKESLSGILGSVSLTAWICLLLPQLIQNYKSQSADGLSMAFLFVWLLGDIANLSGALCTQLAPTAIAIGFYFVFADLTLISQCTYYNTKNARRARRLEREHEQQHRRRAGFPSGNDEDEDEDEDEPLLRRRRSSSIGLPGSHRVHAIRHSESSLDPLTRIITGEDDTPDSSPWMHNTLSLLAVWIVGAAGYFASYHIGAWEATPEVPELADPRAEEARQAIGLALGYFSAVCYLCARIPQILKNYKGKSCEGLALLFFLLSMTGNFTYGASLVAYSQESDFLLTALPWLLGSLGTIVEDCIIFVQFRIYSPKRIPKGVSSSDSDGDGSDSGYGAV